MSHSSVDKLLQALAVWNMLSTWNTDSPRIIRHTEYVLLYVIGDHIAATPRVVDKIENDFPHRSWIAKK